MNNIILLEMLKTAPDSQISPKVRERVLSCKDSIKDLFVWIFNLTEEDRSSFVAKLVDPKYTQQYVD